MTNPNKAKGDAKEREAVEVLREMAPEMLVPMAQRKLGAGRKLDTGDLHAIEGVTIQVKYWPSKVAQSVREAALGAEVQSVNAGTGIHFGMSCMPRVRKGSIRWVASTTAWPTGAPPEDELAVFSTVPRALEHIKLENIGMPRRRRIAVVRYNGDPDIFVAPLDAWIFAFRRLLKAQARDTRGCRAPAAHVFDTPALAS